MPQNFNVDPYYDDFDPTKNFHRILFKPGVAVQARELTQAQTILQDQITKFADNIFKQNSPVTGGQVTTNFYCSYIKLQETYNGNTFDVTDFDGTLIQNETGTVVARIIKTVAASNPGSGIGDPPTFIVTYLSGNGFSDGDVIYDTLSNQAVQAIVSGATGLSSVVSIAQGVFYISSNYTRDDGIVISNGTFVQVNPTTIILDKYDNTPNARVGLNITETIQDYISDTSLLDPAIGASNYQGPGADRYQITLSLETRPLALGDDDGFVELIRVNDGVVSKLVDGSVYNVIDDYFAKRDYETNGDYIVNDFKLTPKTNANTAAYTLSIGKGVAYVHGYRIENPSSTELVSSRARTQLTKNNNAVFVDYGSYFYVDNVKGANASFFNVTANGTIDLHCVPTANVDVSTTNKYNSTLVSSGYIRGLVFDSSESTSQANTYVYKAYIADLQNSVHSNNVVSATSTTVTFPPYFSTANTAYVGVNISITNGTDSGDFRTITAYDGVTKTATINQAWTITPDTTSVFALNYDIKDIEGALCVQKSSYPATILAKAEINDNSKVNNIPAGDTVLQNPTVPELLMRIGSPYVATLTDTSFTTIHQWRDIPFTTTGSGVGASLAYDGDYAGVITHFGTASATLSADLIKENYTIIVTNAGTSSLNVGDHLAWTTLGGGIVRTAALNGDKSTVTFNTNETGTFTATIVAKVFVNNGNDTGHILRNKHLITANTTAVNYIGTQTNVYTWVDDATLTSKGQVYIQKAGLVTPGQKQTLYLSDVKQVVKIIDTKSFSTVPSVEMLSSAAYDITRNYIFDNGQRDSYYDHASITLKPGAPQPLGNILVLVDYYQHSGGDGYFSVESYTNEDYQEIPQYISSRGTVYNLKDVIDFRPARKNADSNFGFRFSNSASNKGVFLPVDLTTFTGDYSYYLGRRDKLVLDKDKNFKIVEGTPSSNPIYPSEPDGALVIANIKHNPYTGYIPTEAPNGFIPDLSIEKVKHKRYTMQDIAGLENRINQVEYYTSLSLLEQKASSLQISDAFGLNRFKNGIMVDDFSSYSTADTFNLDFNAAVNRRERKLIATQNVKNFPLKSLATIYNMGLPSEETSAALDYAINTDGETSFYSLPYETANVITQKIASRTVNVNPFSFSEKEGVLSLSPNVDNWVDTKYSPALLITDPNLQIFRANSQAINVLSAGDWKTVSGTSSSSTSYTIGHGENPSPFGFVGYSASTTYTETTQVKNDILGPYDKIGNTYALNNGYITDISILPYIRSQQVVIRSKGLLTNSTLNAYFDNTSINAYIRKTNVIELTGVSGTFKENDVIGYDTGGVFTPTARVVGVQNYANTSNTRLYVAGDPFSTQYSSTTALQNAYFNENGLYQTTTASGTILSTQHNGGRINEAITSTKIKLSPLASATSNVYAGNTIYINAGTGAGQSAIITNYISANQVAFLASDVVVANGDVYSIGTFKSNEFGSFFGIFNLPENIFHTGQRTLRIDNAAPGNSDAATTYAEATYYAEGLQTTQQTVDFGASPAGAKGTFTQASQQTVTNVSTIISPWDPVAQTFIVSKDNYNNGIFLNSIKVYFRTKPGNDNSPVTLSIVGTQNGYPNGETLDHSIVTLSPEQVKVSESPQYLDPAAYTEFKFPAPIYIQSNFLYAFIVKSNSKEYNLWTAANGDTAVGSSTKNLPTDPIPSIITKVGGAPSVGALFLSQNSQTWTADQNQSLMFVIDRCRFDTSVSPSVQFVVPKKLPERKLIDQSIEYFQNANNISSSIDLITNSDVYVDAFNITTTDFTPSTTGINYSYNATLTSGAAAGVTNITPGKFGTASIEDIHLNDGKGQRVLFTSANTTFSVYAKLSSNDDSVSPIVSDAGLSTYAITYNINNCGLSNNLITITSGGTGYNVACTTVTISAPTGPDGEQAYATANVVDGVIDAIYITDAGAGYITTPTVSIADANGIPGTGATALIRGETSTNGGPALSKYITKKVALDAGFDSGDLIVYLTAYRPVKTNILVYYKILNRNDTQNFNDGSWQLMTMINSSDSTYSQTRNDLYEYSFAPGASGVSQGYVTYTSSSGQTYTSFSQFAIKIVTTTTDETYVPFITDLRAIALPSNVNT